MENKNGLGEETTFDFKYIPDLSKITKMEDAEESGVRSPGIERRNLQALAIGCGLLSLAGYLGFKILGAVVGRIVMVP